MLAIELAARKAAGKYAVRDGRTWQRKLLNLEPKRRRYPLRLNLIRS